ncbi:2-haloalkanoic acid dehalogenase [Penicillium maclennaniae]|uniref:2-haloalkanoic acid dehalogenase n=1 Tax=Penicillium maclennaniae TaxID=1343394 RepID=UPI002541E338|nr:2-haloalkanoic acid dehalogenase [Penicillium maclennaniae]KAJ5662637.1 2-haloalkanoic acid dehalogenase [Penicillium maclennaniae]
MTGRKHVVFDVVGTCVSFDAFYDTINRVIGDRLTANNITAPFFGFSWMTAAELEFTFLSVSARHKPYKQVLESLFYRTLHMAGIAAPREIATEAERNQCVQGYPELQLRPGTEKCFDILRKGGFTVWCLTTGDIERVQGYFERGCVDMPSDNIISCDTHGLAKPALTAYKPTFDRFAPEDDKWFAAGHMWDVTAATKAGFRGAYCTVYEKESCSEIFDEMMDVTAETLPEMAEKIVAASR